MPRRPGRDQRAECIALAELDVDITTSGCQRRRRKTFANRRHRLGVIGVVVGERDPTQPAAPLELGDEGPDVLGQGRSRIDQPRRVAADDPRIRPAQRERPRVLCADADEVFAAGDLQAGHGGQDDRRDPHGERASRQGDQTDQESRSAIAGPHLA